MKNKIETSFSFGIAVCIVAALAMLAATVTVPALSFLIVLLPVPFGYVYVKKGMAWFVTCEVWFAVGAYLIGGLESSLIALAYSVILGYALGRVFSKESDPWKAFFYLVIACVLVLATAADVMEATTGQSFVGQYESSINEMVKEVKVANEEANKTLTKDMQVDFPVENLDALKNTLVSAFFSASVFMSALLYAVARFIYRRLGIGVPERISIKALRLPESALFGSFGIIALFYVAIYLGFVDKTAAMMNLMFVILGVFSFQGAASISRFFGRLTFGGVVSAVVILIVFLMTGTVALGVLGIISSIKQSFNLDVGR